MADSFGTVGFTVLQAGMSRRQSADFALQHIPGGNINYIDAGGAAALEIGSNLLFATEAAYLLMEGKVNTAGTLISAVDGTISSAILTSLARQWRQPDTGVTIAAAAFVVGMA